MNNDVLRDGYAGPAIGTFAAIAAIMAPINKKIAESEAKPDPQYETVQITAGEHFDRNQLPHKGFTIEVTCSYDKNRGVFSMTSPGYGAVCEDVGTWKSGDLIELTDEEEADAIQSALRPFIPEEN